MRSPPPLTVMEVGLMGAARSGALPPDRYTTRLSPTWEGGEKGGGGVIRVYI